MCMAHSHLHISLTHTIVMAERGMWSENNTTWKDRDEFYYSSPPWNADTEEAQMQPRFTNMLTPL